MVHLGFLRCVHSMNKTPHHQTISDLYETLFRAKVGCEYHFTQTVVCTTSEQEMGQIKCDGRDKQSDSKTKNIVYSMTMKSFPANIILAQNFLIWLDNLDRRGTNEVPWRERIHDKRPSKERKKRKKVVKVD